MDKKLRNLLVLAGVLVLLCVGYAVVGLIFPEEDPAPADTTASDGEAQTPLFDVTEDGLTKLAFTYDKDGDGEAEVWSYTRSEDGESWHWDVDPAVPLGASAFYGYSSVIYGLQVMTTVTDVTPAQVSEYGLDKPVKTVTFTDRVYGEQSFWIGAYNTYNGTYCLCKNGDTSTVYMVDGEFYSEFERSVESLVYHDDLPAFKPEALVSLTLTRGERTVTVLRDKSDNGEIRWTRSVGGEAPVTIAADLADSLERLVGDMDYLVCYSVKAEDFGEYGLAEDTTLMTVVYGKYAEGSETEETFTLTLGSADKYGYYHANPKDTTLTMLLGGSVFHKLMTYDDAHVAAGDAAETDTAS